MKKLDAFIGKLLEFIVATFFVITVLVTFLQVFFRYVLQMPLGWSQEVILISFVYSALFGAALAIKNKDHLQVDIIYKAPESVLRVLKGVEAIILFVFISILIYFGWQLVLNNLQSGQVVGILPLKYAYVYLAIPISGILMMYFHIRDVMKWSG